MKMQTGEEKMKKTMTTGYFTVMIIEFDLCLFSHTPQRPQSR